MLKQRIMINYAVQLIEFSIQLVASVVVARIAGPGVFGILIFGLSYVSLINMFVSFGFGSAHLKMVSEGRDVSKCITTYAIMSLINIVMFAIALAAFIYFQTQVFHKPFESPVHQKVVYIYAIYIVINQLLGIPNMTFAATLQQAKISIPHLIQILLINGLRIIAVALGYRTLHLAWIQVLAVCVVIPLILYNFRGFKFGRIDKEYLLISLKYAAPLFFVTTVTALTHYLDKVLIQFELSSEILGYYGAGQKIGSLLNMVAGSIGGIFFPLFSKYVSEKNYVQINSKLFQFNRFVLVFILPFVIFVTFHSKLIVLTILGPKYANSIIPMIFFTIGSFLYLITLPFGNLVFGSGMFKKGMLINVTSSVFYVVVLFILIDPRLLNLGLIGAAMALILFHIMNGILSLTSVRSMLRKRAYIGNAVIMVKVSAIGIILGFLERFALQYFTQTYQSFISAFAYMFLFALLMYLSKSFDKTDIDNLLSLISVKKMGTYVKGEYKTQ